MAWPPPVPPSTRNDATPQATDHADDHNQLATAVQALVDTGDWYVWGAELALTFNSGGVAQVPHGRGVAPVAFGAFVTVTSRAIVLTNGVYSATNLNFVAWDGNDLTTKYVGGISVVHVFGIFPRT